MSVKHKKSKKTSMTDEQTDTTPTEIVCIIDRSGSMGDIRDDAIGGFNTFLKEQQDHPGEATMTIILFDDEYLKYCENTPVRDVQPLTHSTYIPRGSTALLDAIGRTVLSLKERNPTKAIIMILTDGHENASIKYNKTYIKQLMSECEGKGWFVAYLSATVDAFEDAGSVGIGRAQTSPFQASRSGIMTAMFTSSYAAQDYRNFGRQGMSNMISYSTQAKSRVKKSGITDSEPDFSYQPSTSNTK